MRLIKLLLGVALVAAVATMWVERDRVISAYSDESEPIEFRLDGIDLATSRTLIEPSPFVLVASPDLRTATIDPVGSSTPAAPETVLGGGLASFSGTVNGPDGPVVGATVRLERHTTSGIATTQTSTDGSGNWSATGLAGGRWRVRSYLPNTYTSGPAQVFFLANDDDVRVDTVLTGPSLAPVINLVGPEETFVDVPYTFAVTVGIRQVDAEGRIVVLPAPGAEVVVVATTSALTSADVVVADGGGASRFALTCQILGTPTLSVSVSVGGLAHSSGLSLAPCVSIPPPPEPEVVEPDPDAPSDPAADGEATG